MKRVLLCILSALPSLTHAADFDLLALMYPKFPVQATVQELPQGSRVGILDWTFGDDPAPVRRLQDSGKVTAFRIHLINGPGANNNVLGPYEPHYGLNLNQALENRHHKIINHLTRRARLWCDLVKVDLTLSPVLEFQGLSVKAQTAAVEAIKEGCPRARILLNPRIGTKALKGFIIEHHGKNPPPCRGCSTSLDGDDVVDIDVPKWLNATKGYEYKYVWSRSYNCRHLGAFEDPRQRTACPNRANLRELFHITDERPKAPGTNPWRQTSKQTRLHHSF